MPTKIEKAAPARPGRLRVLEEIVVGLVDCVESLPGLPSEAEEKRQALKAKVALLSGK